MKISKCFDKFLNPSQAAVILLLKERSKDDRVIKYLSSISEEDMAAVSPYIEMNKKGDMILNKLGQDFVKYICNTSSREMTDDDADLIKDIHEYCDSVKKDGINRVVVNDYTLKIALLSLKNDSGATTAEIKLWIEKFLESGEPFIAFDYLIWPKKEGYRKFSKDDSRLYKFAEKNNLL